MENYVCLFVCFKTLWEHQSLTQISASTEKKHGGIQVFWGSLCYEGHSGTCHALIITGWYLKTSLPVQSCRGSSFLQCSSPACSCTDLSGWKVCLSRSVVTQTVKNKYILQPLDGDECFLPLRLRYNCAAKGSRNLNAFSSSPGLCLCRHRQS